MLIIYLSSIKIVRGMYVGGGGGGLIDNSRWFIMKQLNRQISEEK